MVTSKLADKDSIAPWLDESICAMSTFKPPITQNEITSMTASDKTLTELRSYIVQGFPETMAKLPHNLQPFWKVRDMLTEYEGLIYKAFLKLAL